MISDTCATSSRAATRGATFLPDEVDGDDGVVSAGERHDECGRRFGKALGELVGSSQQHLADAFELGAETQLRVSHVNTSIQSPER